MGTAFSGVRPKAPLSKEDAQRAIGVYVQHYNEVRLHGAIGHVTPKGRLEHCDKEIHDRRDQQLQEARGPAGETVRNHAVASTVTAKAALSATTVRGTAGPARQSNGTRNECPLRAERARRASYAGSPLDGPAGP
ncbi:MAG: hypothetical protein HN849_21645 [Victivallales bacterium]|nr:hypothetical protein [Victivallales bacterium]